MKKLLETLLKKKKFKSPPVWIMRQAGRYLPEYREIRLGAKNFLDLCYSPKLVAEVTLQPIKRFNFDAAIIFSDILVIPDALGVKVDFVKNEGPKLQKISETTDLKNLKTNNIKNHLNPVFEALDLVKSKLPSDKTLIGFSGSPWTLACYMIEGGSSKNFNLTRKTAIANEKFFSQLIDVLTNSVIEYILLQIEAGAEVIKLFDSWAGILPPYQLKKWVIEPSKKILKEIKKIHPQLPLIFFPRGISAFYEDFLKEVNTDGIALDQCLSTAWVMNNLQKFDTVFQGNLDNFLLAFGSKDQLKFEVSKIVDSFSDKPFIFNLGHGILPETPIENVEFILNVVRNVV